jgi:hypothetical protein
MIVERCFPALLVAVAVAFLAVFAAPPAQAQRQARNEVFAVTVPVDATAATASAARDAARADGQRRAFRQLVERLAASGDAARLPRIDDATLTNMVQDIEVANERSSAVRYLAEYTYRFRPDAVRRLLRQANVAFAETPSKPVVVVPVLRRGDGAVLWDDPNPWRRAWAARKPGGLVPVIVPDGDLGDVAAVDAEQAVAAKPEALDAIAAKYGGGDVLLAIVSAPAGDGGAPLQQVELGGGRYAAGGKLAVPVTGSVRANQGENEADFLARAVAATMRPVEEAWKKETLIRSGDQSTLAVSVPVVEIDDWVAVRDRLAGLPAIRQAELLALTRREARLALHYVGDPSQLKLALAQRDLVLTEGQPLWILTRRPAAGR